MYDGKKPGGLMFCACSAAFLPWLHLYPSHSSTDITDTEMYFALKQFKKFSSK